jgi:hypothetical protein
MIGLRRAEPDRQGDPIATHRQRNKSADRFNVKCKNCSIRLFWRWISPLIIVVRYQQSAIGRSVNERSAVADSLRKRDKNGAIILRHDPAK